MKHPLGGPERLPSLHVLVVFTDTGQRGHVENVSDAVLRLQRGTLQVGGAQLLGCVGALSKITSTGINHMSHYTWHCQIFCLVFMLIIKADTFSRLIDLSKGQSQESAVCLGLQVDDFM